MVNRQGTRPRDSQREKLYRAEQALQTGPEEALRSVAQMQAFVDSVLAARWFQSRWGDHRSIEVRAGQRHTSAVSYGAVLHMPLWSRQRIVLLHELAHSFTPDKYAWHGPEFAGVYLTLVRYTLGQDAYLRLRVAFREGRVRSNNKAVPPAGTWSVVTKSQQRQAALKKANRPLSTADVAAAVDVLRRAAKQGVFGDAGRKPRTAALSTARTLETWKGAP